jgi:ribosome biogenesis GTPase
VTLGELGWDDAMAAGFAAVPNAALLRPARVTIEFNHNYRVLSAPLPLGGEPEAAVAEVEVVATGRLKHEATSRSQLPAVGDWVAVRVEADGRRGRIVAILPRRSQFSRKAAGEVTDQQIVAANVDVVGIVMALDADFSVRRLERYLLLVRESGAQPLVLLTKPDLCPDVAGRLVEVSGVAQGAPVHVVNPRLGEGTDIVRTYVPPGRTGALLGSSGVGKSTIINRLIGSEVQKTREVREGDSKGRHTTTHRELVAVPGAGLIIDTPGMRELQLWDATESVRGTFDDIDALAGGCHFADCGHDNEPKCAVKAAVAAGSLPADRLVSYVKL